MRSKNRVSKRKLTRFAHAQYESVPELVVRIKRAFQPRHRCTLAFLFQTAMANDVKLSKNLLRMKVSDANKTAPF